MDDTPLVPSPPHARTQPPDTPAMMHVLYAMHTLAWITLGTLAVVALVANYLLRGETWEPLYRAHHGYMIATFWWTIFWLAITSPLYLLFVLPGVLAHSVVGLWYLYRCLRGWLRLNKASFP